VSDRIQGSRWLSILLPLTMVALVSTLVPPHAAAQTASLVIETVPPIDGITFRLEGEAFSTNEMGVARINLASPGSFELQTDNRIQLGYAHRAELAAWSDGITEADRIVEIDGSTQLQVGFRVDYLIAESFRNSEGQDLDPDSVGPFDVVDDTGQTTTYPGSSRGLAGPTAQVWERFPAGTRWLPAVRIVTDNGLLSAETVSYRVRSISIEGEQVSASSDPFTPSPGAKWGIEVNTSNPLPRGLTTVSLLLGAAIALLLVMMWIRRRSQRPVVDTPNIERGFIHRRKAPDAPATREFVRIRLDTGRTIEGWRIPSDVDESAAVILNVAGVWGPDGREVTQQPTDSFLFPSQIAHIEVF
jgi:hypothetical protein